MKLVKREIMNKVINVIGENKKSVHIYGEPGVGKTILLNQLSEELSKEYKIYRITLSNYDDIPVLLERINIEMKGRLTSIISRIKNLSIYGIGVQLDSESTIPALEKSIKSTKKALLILDDIHKLKEEPNSIKDILGMISKKIKVISAGRINLKSEDIYNLELRHFIKDETIQLIKENIPRIKNEEAEELHKKLQGHPYYFGLFIESYQPGDDVKIPNNQVFDYIERNYLESLTNDEESFLVSTSPLIQLDHKICSSVLKEFSATDSRRMLKTLSGRCIVQYLGRSSEDVKVYRIHDKFRELLYDLQDNLEEIHREAFNYYINEMLKNSELFDLKGLASLKFHKLFIPLVLATHHIYEIYVNPTPDDVQKELNDFELDTFKRLLLVLYLMSPLVEKDKNMVELLFKEIDQFKPSLHNILKGKITHRKKVDDLCDVLICYFKAMICFVLKDMIQEKMEEKGRKFIHENLKIIENAKFKRKVIGPICKRLIDSSEFEQLCFDGLRIIGYVFLLMGSKNDIEKQEAEKVVVDLLKTYGLQRDITLNIIQLTRELFINLEEKHDRQIDRDYDEKLQDMEDVSLNLLIDPSFQREIDSIFDIRVNILLKEISGHSDLLEKYIIDCGDEISRSQNPMFPSLYYLIILKISQNVSRKLLNERVLNKFQEKFDMYYKLRKSYEKSRSKTIFNIDKMIPPS